MRPSRTLSRPPRYGTRSPNHSLPVVVALFRSDGGPAGRGSSPAALPTRAFGASLGQGSRRGRCLSPYDLVAPGASGCLPQVRQITLRTIVFTNLRRNAINLIIFYLL